MMRRITLWLLSTVAALVLLFSYRTSIIGANATTAAATTSSDDSTTTTASGGSDSQSSSTSSVATTYEGSVAQTRWGPVQVTITVTDGKITSVAVPTYPNSNGKDKAINAHALPILKQETLAAQSADIDTVSGATVTSRGYTQSLQAALDTAHLS
jgi:uncharacterized protein with FMN-binding domain